MSDESLQNIRAAIYQSAGQYWVHTETARLSMGYNRLTANSIFILAWAAIFTAKPDGHLVLSLLSVVGLVINSLSIGLARRANKITEESSRVAKEAEKALLGEHGHSLAGPFVAVDNLKDKLTWREKPRTAAFLLLVPAFYLLAFMVLFYFSLTG